MFGAQLFLISTTGTATTSTSLKDNRNNNASRLPFFTYAAWRWLSLLSQFLLSLARVRFANAVEREIRINAIVITVTVAPTVTATDLLYCFCVTLRYLHLTKTFFAVSPSLLLATHKLFMYCPRRVCCVSEIATTAKGGTHRMPC